MPRSVLLFLFAILFLQAAALEAQGGRRLQVRGFQTLDFGDLLGGLPKTILRTDPLNSGQFRIGAEKASEIVVTFLLPPALQGPGGGTVPLSFGPGSAGYSMSRDITTQVAIDPEVPTLLTLPRQGRADFYLGGTANPPAAVTVGRYSATIVMTVSITGN